MIPVVRSSEPPALAAARGRKLPIAVAEYLGPPVGVTTELKAGLVGYDVAGVKKTLWQDHHHKCAYCETKPGLSGQPIEHFRPRKEAWRHLPGEDRDVDHDRYWWLTWTWENLLFACHRCNVRGRKGNYFPLVSGTSALAPRETDLSLESPLLIDPTEVDLVVAEHLRWVPVDVSQPLCRWSWHLKGRSDRGRAVTAIIDPGYRADSVTDRFRETVWPALSGEPLHALKADDVRAAQVLWDRLVRTWLRPERELVFATWCMLEWMREQVSPFDAAGLYLEQQ